MLKKTIPLILICLSISIMVVNAQGQFVGSKDSNVYHYPNCSYVNNILEANKVWFTDAAQAVEIGYRPCSRCNPPLPQATSSPTASPTISASPTPSTTPTPTSSPSLTTTPTPSNSPLPSSIQSVHPTEEPTPSTTPSTPTLTPTQSASPNPTLTPSPTIPEFPLPQVVIGLLVVVLIGALFSKKNVKNAKRL